MGLISFNSYSDLPSFNRFFDDFFQKGIEGFNPSSTQSIAVNARENETEFTLELALPGIKKEEVDIALEKDTLTVSSATKSSDTKEKQGYTRKEFGHFSFKKVFTLPELVDREKVKASFQDGVLKIELPKLEKENQNHKRLISIG